MTDARTATDFRLTISFWKAGGQRAGLSLSTSCAANMNEWQKVGSEIATANDRMWVCPVVARRLMSGDHGGRNRLPRLQEVCGGRCETAVCDRDGTQQADCRLTSVPARPPAPTRLLLASDTVQNPN